MFKDEGGREREKEEGGNVGSRRRTNVARGLSSLYRDDLSMANWLIQLICTKWKSNMK